MVPTRSDDPRLTVAIHQLADEAEARRCAEIMATSDPWRTLGRTFDESLAMLRDPAREVYVAHGAPTAQAAPAPVLGFVIVVMQGAFVGYIQTVAVREDARGAGVGSALIAFAERRILRAVPNVFICVSSFNPAARRLYERLGYHVVGVLTDYIVSGHDEILLRKTIAPLAAFTPAGSTTESGT